MKTSKPLRVSPGPGRQASINRAVPKRCPLWFLAALVCLGTLKAQAATVDVSGGISPGDPPNNPLQTNLFTWTSQIHVAGTGLAANESVTVSLHGPLNSLGVAPTDRVLGSLTADSLGNLNGDVIIPYDNGIIGTQGQNLPNIPRPGFYAVRATGGATGLVIAGHGINLCPATKVGDSININWGMLRGGRDGFLGDHSPERTDPEWISVWDEKPAGVYATIAETDGNNQANTDGNNQPAFISHEDWPGGHYAHDVNQMLVPDPEYRWVLTTANFYGSSNAVNRGRTEFEWEAQSHGNDNGSVLYGYGTPNRGMPLWVMGTAGDRVYTVGRWALDNGHPDNGDRAELHPARLLATMRKRNTAVPLNSLGCMTRASQVDIYVSGHGGGANQ